MPIFVFAMEYKRYEGRPTEGNENRTAPELAVYDFLDRLGISYETYCHPAAFTMDECAEVREAMGASVFKNLFLTNRQGTVFYLLMMPADKPFKTKYLSSQLGCARLSFASEDAMWEMLRIHPGAVSPMGLINDTGHRINLIIDRDLMSRPDESYGCHPCVNTASLKLPMSVLLEKFLPATGHTYTLVDLKPE